MRKFVSIVIALLGIAVAAFQQISWIMEGYYASTSPTRVIVSILISLIVMSPFLMISKAIKDKDNTL